MSAARMTAAGAAIRLFDAHCHLQDPRVLAVAPQLIRTALDSGIRHFAVNGVSEGDWHIVKQMADEYPSVVPCFGLHPWYVRERSSNWFESLKVLLETTPTAAVGEIGLDKGSHGKQIDFTEQIHVFEQQLELAKRLDRPVSVHCVRAFGDLMDVMQRIGPFPAGVILHSYVGSAELVPGFAKLGSYFSFSGYLTFVKHQKAKKMLKSVPIDRILLESDAPDGLPKLDGSSLLLVPGDPAVLQDVQKCTENNASAGADLPKETLNHPANVVNILRFVAELLEIPENEVAEASYRNTVRLFSYPGSKVCNES